MEEIRPFEFKQCTILLRSTGKKAGDLRQFRDVLAVVSEASIFHHTYQYFLRGPVLEYTNDFAKWMGETLEQRALAEQLSNADPYVFSDIGGLRGELLRIIDEHLEKFPEGRGVLPGEEFYFNETVTFVFQTGIRARNLAEFLIAIRYIDPGSIYYHFYEARRRVEGGADDFSNWVREALGAQELGKTIEGVDPFMHDIEKIRAHILEAVEAEVRRDMESTTAYTQRPEDEAPAEARNGEPHD